MPWRLVLTVLTLAIGAPAFANGTDRHSGFVTRGDGTLTGRVTDGDGKPLARVDVHVLSSTGAGHIVTTDAGGHYRVTLGSGTWVVFVNADAQVGGQLGTARGDVSELYDTIPARTMPRPLSNPAAIPAYSDAAIARNAWARAWLLLDIDETGTVTRLKLLRAPGHDLDAIAIREGLALQFEPARDAADQPMRSLLLWSFEWPSYWWMVRLRRATPRRLPPEVATIPCRGSGPTSSLYRDCSRPDQRQILSAPWISPDGP
jgi:hypothetical protein